MIGQKILHYKITEKLGEGGMGVVYKAEDTKLKRDVAIKFLPRQIAASDEERQRFKIEAQAAAALNHPNIATIYAIEEVDDELFIVMEYIDGKELRELIIHNSTFAIDNCLSYATQIAEGLQAAHKKGVTHRDIKSANIMITDEDQVKIMDFGLAKVRGSAQLTKVGTTLGTAAYMSPEQTRGESTDHRTDIWAFGVVLYEMLTGELPFKGDYEQAVIYSILNEEPESVTELRHDAPEPLVETLEKALQKDADARYQSAKDLLADLKKGGAKPTSESTKKEQKKIPSIAVLPFANMSADPEQEYFCDGMAEEIINALTRLENLHVSARTSSFYFKGEKLDIREVGEKLNVAHVLEGSVRKAGNRLRITAQLIKIADGYHLWSERFDRELTDVFEIQDEIALTIVEKLKIELLAKDKSAIQKRGTDNLEAYQLYLKGRHFVNNRPKRFIEIARANFRRAIELDPDFAPPYAGLAQLHTIVGGYEFIEPKEAFSNARRRAEQALKLDSQIAEAHGVMATIKFLYDRDYDGAKQAYQRTLELNPDFSYARGYYAILLAELGKKDEAIAEALLAKSSDPLSSTSIGFAGALYYASGDFDKAIVECKEALEIEPTNFVALWTSAFSHSLTGRHEEAIKMAEALVRNTARAPSFLGILGYVYAMAGDEDRAQKLVDELQKRMKKEFVSCFSFAFIYTGLKDNDKAFEWLDRACDERSPITAVLNFHSIFQILNSDKRYTALLQKMGQ
ncbi:MAG: protein kinase, partial [bacterium]